MRPANGGSSAVVAERLTVSYGPTVVLDGLDLTVSTGTAVALVGENGAGKSTLLRCIAGIQAPTDGTVRVFEGTPGTSLNFWREVATTVDSPTWYHGLTVREHLELVRVANGADADDGYIDEMCDALELHSFSGSLPSTLSSGQRQRFLLTATLVRPSRLLLLDEPEQRLDSAARRAVATHLATYVRSGGTLIMASHDPQFVTNVGATSFVVGEREL